MGKRAGFIPIVFFTAAALLLSSNVFADEYQNIVEVWGQAQPPKPVELKTVTVKPAETAFLILDIQQSSCNTKRRPRCVATVPHIAKFLAEAKSHGVAVVYSLAGKAEVKDILSPVAPSGGEPVVKSSVDKFYKTDLEKILRDKGINTVVISGTTAEGAVIHTATAAAMRGFDVIVPVDGMSAGTLYAEQYTAWHLINAPGSRRKTTLTSFDKIGF